MNSSNIIFSFSELSVKDKASKVASKQFSKAGATVVTQDVSTQVKRTSGISYREMTLTFADSQTIVFRIKQSGDIYQVLLNGKVVPIRNQDNHAAAIEELAAIMNAGRAKHQQKLAKMRAKLPPAIRTAAPNMLKMLTDKRDWLVTEIAGVNEQIAAIRGA
jgi:hypothetical protein